MELLLIGGGTGFLLLLGALFVRGEGNGVDVDLGDSQSQFGMLNKEAGFVPDDCLSETLRMSGLTMNSSLAFTDGFTTSLEPAFYSGCGICHHDQSTCSRSPRQAVQSDFDPEEGGETSDFYRGYRPENFSRRREA